MPNRKQTSPAPIILAIGGGLLLLAVAFILASQNAPSAPAPAPSHDEETYPDIPRITIEEAKSALETGAALVVDVRSAEAYAGGHIAGAINIPLAELETRIVELDPNLWIITYCT